MTTNTGGLHNIQASILRVLMYKPKAKFSELNTEGVSNDHFTFHIKRLQELGYVEKLEDGEYQLTDAGKEFGNRFDVDAQKPVLERQAKIGVLVAAVQGGGKERKYLSQQRLKQPFYGFYGFVTGKVKWGEAIMETAARELEEETGLTAGNLTLIGVEHKMDYDQDGNLLEDKYFYIVRAESTTGALKEVFEGGRNVWLTKEAILRLPDLFQDVAEVLEVIAGDKLVFLESKYITKKY